MNAQQIISWMSQPGNLGKDASAQLDALTQTFPYFQTAHLLYIKSLHNENSFLYNNQLKVSAAYVTNRKVLYELITKKAVAAKEVAAAVAVAVKEAEVKEEVEEVVEKEVVEKEKEEIKNVAEVVKEEPKEIIQPEFPKKRFVSNPDEWESGMLRQLQLLHHWKTTPAELLAKKTEEIFQTPSTEKIIEKEIVETSASVEKPIVEEEKTPTAADEINTLLYVLVEPGESEDLSQAEEEISVANEETENWEVTVLENEPEQTEEPETTEILQKKEPVYIPQDEVSQEIIREAISSSIELEVDGTMPSLEELGIPNRDLNYAKRDEKREIRKEIEKEIVAEKPEIKTPAEELTFTSWLKQITPGEKVEEAKKPEIKTEIKQEVVENKAPVKPDLVEKFIKEEPRIKPPSKTSFFNPVNMAKKSVQDNDEFITETLARIYAKQGNIPKAIRAYQKLSLKFPEKSSYFAALIEELKRTSK
jgi:hypothetical protein